MILNKVTKLQINHTIPNEYEQETIQEYEKYRDEFLKWKESQDNVIDL